MGVTMGVGVPVVVSMVVGMGVSHPEMLYYNITGVHGPKPKPIALCGLHQYGPSKSVLCPDGADFFIRREVATLSLSQRSVEIGFFFGRQHIGRLRHARNIAASGPRGKRCARPHGFPIAIASAAARNGNGTDTAARNQTNFAGMNGISHRISRWKANSAQATT